MKYCTVENGVVTSIIKAEAPFNGHNVLAEADTAIGDLYDGSTFSKPEITVPIKPLEEQKQDKINQLQTKYQLEYNAYLSQYPQREIASFPAKQAEALAYTADNTAPTPVIDAILTTNPATKADYVASIMAKITALANQEGAMVAIRDSIKACTTQDELDAIVI